MVMISKLLIRVALIVIAVYTCSQSAQAQYAMSLRFDTVLDATPGDTVNVNVYYKFTEMPAKSVQDFDVRFEYDTSEIYAFDYILDGTASANMFILDTSHRGILAANGSMDFSNPILFKIRFRVNKALADTAFIHWDSASVFDYTDSIDVTKEEGWIRTPSAAGHVTLTTPSIMVDTGEVFNLPVSISGIDNANIDSVLLRIEVDTTRLLFRGVGASSSSNAILESWSSNLDTISITLKATSGHIVSADSMITISLFSIAWFDTACVMPQEVHFEVLNSSGLIGNTSSSNGSICIAPGSKPPADVSPAAVQVRKLSAYPNPARDQVTFDAGDRVISGQVLIEVYDPLGRRAYMSRDAYPVWQIPSDIRAGTYFVVMDSETGRLTTSLVIQP
jgi:hypothetical protein